MYRKNGVLDIFTDTVSDVGVSALKSAMPAISAEIQQIAQKQSASVVNELRAVLPDRSSMIALGKEISLTIQQAINQNILPQLYNRPSKLGSVLLSDSELRVLYDKGIKAIPQRKDIPFNVMGTQLTLSLDLRKVVQSGLPFSTFKEMVTEFDPLINTVKAETIPFVEDRAKDLATLAIASGFVAGALVMFGMTKLYYSFERSSTIVSTLNEP